MSVFLIEKYITFDIFLQLYENFAIFNTTTLMNQYFDIVLIT